MRLSTHTIEEVKAWLTGFGTLSFSWVSDKQYQAKCINRIDIAQSLQIFGDFTLIFKAQSFAYSVSNNIITVTSSGSMVTNPGIIYSEPVMKVYGSGTINLTVNSTAILLSNVSSYVTIDTPLMDCYKDTTLQNGNMNGDFPTLQSGSNTISWAGTVTKIEITPNWRWLW